jgi:ribosomal protein S6
LKRTYETMVLLDNREVKKGWQNLKDEVCGLFSKHGAEVKSARRWDERRLAYPIAHQLRGTYMLMYIASETSELAAIRRELEYYESVLRYVTLACDEIPADAFEPETEFDEAAVRVEDTATARAAMAAGGDAESSEEGGGDSRRSRSSRGSAAPAAPVAEAAPVADAAPETDEGGGDTEGRETDADKEGDK